MSANRTLSLRPQTVSARKDLKPEGAHGKSVDKVQKSAEELPCPVTPSKALSGLAIRLIEKELNVQKNHSLCIAGVAGRRLRAQGENG